jgi:O-antigen biosynthesis protein
MNAENSVSIVVLTHNNLVFTRECFDALRQNTQAYELVVVDNASTDGTPDYLRELQRASDDVKVVLNAHNAGFAAGCNIGVAEASFGKICLLNNDTVPYAGWLDNLRSALEEGVGAVGAKLLLANNTIQHAGIEFEHRLRPVPHFWPYHRFLGEPSDLPAANVLEAVPAVTAACLLTTRAIWDEVGGMDEGYSVANFEDVDFNLAVRDAGYRVIYQPRSRLLHYWGTTVNAVGQGPGTPAAHFGQNFSRLMDKWNNKLAAGLYRVSKG